MLYVLTVRGHAEYVYPRVSSVVMDIAPGRGGGGGVFSCCLPSPFDHYAKHPSRDRSTVPTQNGDASSILARREGRQQRELLPLVAICRVVA